MQVARQKETPKAKNSKLQPKPNGLPRLASVPDKLNPDEDPMRVMFYACEGKPKGLVVFAPGSRGGMGPGQSMSTIGQFNPRISSIYPDVAKSLSSQGIASVHLTWRLNPTRKGAPPGTLKSPTQLMLGVADIALAARYLRAQYGKRGASLPLVLVGFSFGGPSTMAAGALAVLPDGGVTAAAAGASGVAPISGVVTIGCGMRVDHTGTAAFKDMGNRLVGGASRARPHHYNGVDSESCVDAYAAAGLPLAMIHGLADVTVDPRASATIFARARGPKAALWLEGADHQARTRFDIVSRTLIEWLPLLLERPAVHPAAEAPSQPLPPPSTTASEQSEAMAAGRQNDDENDTTTAEQAASDGGSDDEDDEQESQAEPSYEPSEADVGEEAAGEEGDLESSDAASEIEESASVISTFRCADQETSGNPVPAVGGLNLDEPWPPSAAAAAPDEHCPFLDGEARTL